MTKENWGRLFVFLIFLFLLRIYTTIPLLRKSEMSIVDDDVDDFLVDRQTFVAV